MSGALVLTGCNAAFSKREIVVQFSPSATQQQHRAVLTKCAHAAPHTSAEPQVHSNYVSSQENDVRFRIDKADDHDLAQLYSCLGKQAGVLGVSDPMDMTR